jgi:hypothetical protein
MKNPVEELLRVYEQLGGTLEAITTEHKANLNPQDRDFLKDAHIVWEE